MSRSYKKTPRCGDQKNKFFKTYSNRRLRRTPINDEDILRNSSYKKYSCSWNICDYEEVGTSFEEFLYAEIRHAALAGEPIPSMKELKKSYFRWYRRK